MVFYRISENRVINLEFVREWTDGYFDPNDTGPTLPAQEELPTEHQRYWLTMLFEESEPITLEGEPAKSLAAVLRSMERQ